MLKARAISTKLLAKIEASKISRVAIWVAIIDWQLINLIDSKIT